MRKFALVLSCEHASNKVPRMVAPKLDITKAVLASHRGWDIGAKAIMEQLAAEFGAPAFAATFSRLAIDANRSLHNRGVFSKWSRQLDADAKQRLVDDFYLPYRSEVEEAIGGLLKQSPLLHLAVHSFTPVLNGERRSSDIGLLYDPSRPMERRLCLKWQQALRTHYRTRRNYPYRGSADGFTTALRKQFGRRYLGIELEINQKHLIRPREIHAVTARVASTLRQLVD